jgi:hypothetical protein
MTPPSLTPAANRTPNRFASPIRFWWTKASSVTRVLFFCFAWFAPHTFAAGDEGFESLFDGRSLQGWAGQDMSFWSVEDGAVTGTISPQHAPRMNQYLIWQSELLQDFELKLWFRFTACSAKNENGGFQFRSRRLPNGDVAGYQVDNNFGCPWKVRLYDEHGRHDLALEGEQSVFDPRGQKHTEKLVLEPGASDFHLDDWHEYHLIAQGQKLALRINGRLVAVATDLDPASYEPAGVLGLQLHTGPPMKVQFRDIRLKRLIPVRQLDPREKLFLEASLHWKLWERVASYQPPLQVVGKITTGSPPSGSGANPLVTVARFEQAFLTSDTALNDGKTWNVPGQALTVFLRAQVPDGQWTTPLLTKGTGDEEMHFSLSGTALHSETNSEIVFNIRTDQGRFAVRYPMPESEAKAWHGWIGRYDGRQVQLLCDGRVVAQRSASGTLSPSPQPLLVGGELTGSQPSRSFTGQMEEVALWSHALRDEDIALIGHRPSGTH